MGRDYLYYMMREDGRFCKVVNGNVVLVSTPSPLEHTPDKWLDIEVTRQRNNKYFGVERSFTAPLDFVKDGALILKHFYYTAGIEDKLYLLIADKRLYIEPANYLSDEQGNPLPAEDGSTIESEDLSGYYYYYSALYKGEIDFSQFLHAGPKVTLNIMEGGVSKLLKAHENTRYDLAMNSLPWIWVKMDGVYLHEKKNFLIPGATEENPTPIFTAGDHLIGIVNTTQEGKAPGITTYDVYTKNGTFDFATSTEYFMASAQVVENIRIQGTLKFDHSLSAGESKVYIKTNLGREIELASFDGNGDYELDIDMFFDTQANETYFLYMSTPAAGTFSYSESTMVISFRSRFATTYVKWVKPLDLYKAVAVKMGIPLASSKTLDFYKDVVISCGDAIRGFENPVIKTSLSDFFTSFNSILGLAIGIENLTLVCENKNIFADYTNPIALGECKDLKVTPATEYLHNTIKIGFPEVSYEDVNGRYEFNGTHIYTTPITRITKELNLVSIYRADSLGIEYTRINFEGKTTTDGDSDNDVFVMRIGRRPFITSERTYYEIDRSLNQYAAGLLERDTVFNLWLSPKRCLLRNGSYIRSCFFNQDHEKIKFQSTGKNKDLVVTQTGYATVVEGGDIEISELDAAIFNPNVLEFVNKNPVDILELLKAKPGVSFTFTNDGVNYQGLTIKSSVKPASKEAQTFQLLAAPFTNMKYLISYDG